MSVSSRQGSLSTYKKGLYVIVTISLILMICAQLVYANNGYASLDEMIAYAESRQYASDIFNAYRDAYMIYPNDNRAIAGLEKGTITLLRYAQRVHRKGDFSVATSRYRHILNTTGVPEYLLKSTEACLSEAESRVVLVSVNEMLAHAESRQYASDIFNAYRDAYMIYPNDNRAIAGLEKGTITLLRYAQRVHRKGDFSVATSRYRHILKTTGVPEYLLKSTEACLSEAESRAVLVSANEMYAYAQSQQYVSTIFSAYVDGYKLYPYDSRFVKGVEKSTTNLFNWSQKKHRLGSFDEAILRYDLILRKSGEVKIIDDIANTVKRLKQLAALNVMPTAKEQYERAEGSIYVSTIFSEYLKGYRAFPSDPLFKEGLEKSTIKLLKWSQWKHANGYIQEAIHRYNLILNSPEVPEYLMEATKASKSAADRGEVIKSADEMYAYAESRQYASDIFNAYKDAYMLYSYDSRAKAGIEKGTTTLLGYADRLQDKGDYKAAICRYNMIIRAYGIPGNLHEKTMASLLSAQKALWELEQNIFFTDTQYNETFDSVLSKQMSCNPQTDLYGGGWKSALQSEVAYHLDPTNFVHPQYIKGQDIGSKMVQITASALNVRTGPATSYARIRQVSSGKVYIYTEVKDGWYKIWVNDRFGWVSGDYVREASSGATTIDSPPAAMYQFLVLSGSSGITADEINTELTGKGIFEGKGQAFMEAGQYYNVNEIYLLAHALLETGNGTSALANGILVDTVDGSSVTPKVVYNMYGIGAMDKDPIRLGSEYAYKQGWFTPEDAIIGGASWIEDGYINNSSYQQDTLYKMRWNPANPGAHQYATDIGWALKQTANMDLIVDIYSRHNIPLRFDIPVYN